MELHGVPSKSANMQQGIKLITIVFNSLRILSALCGVICLLILWIALLCTNPDLPEQGFLKYICIDMCVCFNLFIKQHTPLHSNITCVS